MRNVIAHNHLWEATTRSTKRDGLKFVKPPNLREGYGDKHHMVVTVPQTRKSRILDISGSKTRPLLSVK